MHRQGLAHRDVKPQNVLLRASQQRAQHQEHQEPQQPHAGGDRAAAGQYDPMPPLPLAAPDEDQILQRQEPPPDGQAGLRADGEQGWAAESWQSDGAAAGRGVAAAAAAAYTAAGAPAGGAAKPDGQQRQQQQHQKEAWWAERLHSWQTEHEGVLMDFGSTRPALVEVRNRAEAMAAQEDAEVGGPGSEDGQAPGQSAGQLAQASPLLAPLAQHERQAGATAGMAEAADRQLLHGATCGVGQRGGHPCARACSAHCQAACAKGCLTVPAPAPLAPAPSCLSLAAAPVYCPVPRP